jgi:hypothetical protein
MSIRRNNLLLLIVREVQSEVSELSVGDYIVFFE